MTLSSLDCSSGTSMSFTSRLFRSVGWPLVFAAILLSVRLWSLEPNTAYRLSWDEATFILVASSLLDGQLPYVGLFDIKPPGIFFALAGAMSLFGENLLTVRLFGTFCLLIAAFFGYAIVRRQTSRVVAGLSIAVLCALTFHWEFQPTLTEHLAMALLMPAVWLLVAGRDDPWQSFFVGVLLSFATLTRTNIAFVVFAIGLFYNYRSWGPRAEVPRVAVAAYIAGVAAPFVPLVIIYWLADGLDVLFLSLVRVPLSFASSQMSMMETLHRQAGFWMGSLREFTFIILPATFYIVAGLAGCAFSYRRERCLDGNHRLLLVLAAVSVSVIAGGAAYLHYQLQILPLLLPLAGIGVGTLCAGGRRWQILSTGLAIVIVSASIVRFGGDSARATMQSLTTDPRSDLRVAADMILDDRRDGDTVYAPKYHLIYWYLEQPPPSRVVHPSSLVRDAIMTPLVEKGYVPKGEQRRVLNGDVRYIVRDAREEVSYLSDEWRVHLDQVIETRYALWNEIGALVIYKRTDNDGSVLKGG